MDCPICEAKNSLVEIIEDKHVEGISYLDLPHVFVYGLIHSECTECGSYIGTPKQSRINKQLIINARQRYRNGENVCRSKR
jgi:hypothetical protein